MDPQEVLAAMSSAAHPDAAHLVAELHAFLTRGRAAVQPAWAGITGMKALADSDEVSAAEDKAAAMATVVDRTNAAAAHAVTEARKLFS